MVDLSMAMLNNQMVYNRDNMMIHYQLSPNFLNNVPIQY